MLIDMAVKGVVLRCPSGLVGCWDRWLLNKDHRKHSCAVFLPPSVHKRRPISQAKIDLGADPCSRTRAGYRMSSPVETLLDDLRKREKIFLFWA